RSFSFGNVAYRERFAHARSIARCFPARPTGANSSHGERIAAWRHQSAIDSPKRRKRARVGAGNSDEHARRRERDPRSEDVHASWDYSDREKTRHAIDG